MTVKIVNIDGIGDVSLYKRRGINGIKMSLTHDGKVRITLPSWAPYKLGTEFAKNKAEWIMLQRKPVRAIHNGDRVGKAHRISFEPTSNTKPYVRIIGTDIVTYVPLGMQYSDNSIQHIAEKGAIKALKKEAEQLLPMRLATLAQQNGFEFSLVKVKKLKSRWGSCNERKEITFNMFLMQLPWHLIDYVILHELMHTKVLRHGHPFWSALEEYVKDLKSIRKEMKQYQPVLTTFPSIIPSDSESIQRSVIIETT